MKVDKGPGHGPNGECWLWTAARKGREGMHGQIGIRGSKTDGAHRVSWQIHKGPIPKGMYVCHKCDFGLCVNPDHLFLDDNAGNMHDRWRKGRYRTFAPTSREVAVMCELRDIGTSYAKIGRMFGFSQETIRRIMLGATRRPIATQAPSFFDELGLS